MVLPLSPVCIQTVRLKMSMAGTLMRGTTCLLTSDSEATEA